MAVLPIKDNHHSKESNRFHIAMAPATLEHLLYWYSFIHDKFRQAEACNWIIESWVSYIVSNQLRHIFRIFPVNVSTVFWAEYMNISFTFIWNFVDLFIMVISMSIATKFKMINERLEYHKGTVGTKEFWDEIRLHYNKVCDVNDYVCDLFGSLICCGCLYIPNSSNMIYFIYSTIFIMCRTFAMILISASIHDESIKPLKVFRTIPSDGWIIEVQRLSDQIQHGNVVLSGRKLFNLTRDIIIPIIGTIM
ncbi:gustatory receptor for sugar taste 64f-like [Chironomus tepperi]|uniref:gustatory receptor for sugar taste 64f-like n=1 Tax=Chironomus tepperi TaxID=113505 RepID=UPI00391F98A8